jgi:hypothetical protein
LKLLKGKPEKAEEERKLPEARVGSLLVLSKMALTYDRANRSSHLASRILQETETLLY